MFEFLRGIFGTDFMPHLYCLRNDPGVLWLEVVSDLAIAAAYFAIPVVLLEVMRKRPDPHYRRVAVLFVLFIAACGTTHVLEVWTIWVPMYRLEGVAKAVTAVLSAATVLALVTLRRYLSQIPSVAELEAEVARRRAAEEAARDKEERFRSFVESVEDYAIYMIDPEGIVLTWNHGAERLKGYTASEVVGQSFSRFYTPEDRARGRPMETLRVVRETGRYEGEGWRVRKDGTRFLANVVLRPMYDAEGRVRGYSKVTRDLTESREMEAKYQMLLEAAPDAIVIVDEDGGIGFVNRQAERLFGYDRWEVMGKPVDMLVPTRTREAQAVYRDSFFEGAVHPSAKAPPEILGLRKDGSEFPLEFSVSPLETRDGRVLLFSVRDLTEQRRTEARFRALLDSAPDAMVISGSDGRIELANLQAERLFGYTRAELTGQPVEMLVPPDLHDTYRQDATEFLGGDFQREMGSGVELRARRKDGSEVPVEIRFSPLEGPNGISMTAAIRDISERRRSEMRFRALMEAAPDAIVVVDAAGRIQFVNKQAEKLYGYDRAELAGKPGEMLAPPRLRAERVQYRDRLLAGAMHEPEAEESQQVWGLRKDGSEFPLEFSFSPFETGDGKLFLFAIRDISERLKTEARFRALLNSAPEAMVIVNIEGRIELLNLEAEKLFGYGRAELVGQSVDMLVPESLRGAHGGHRADFFLAPRQREMGAGLELMAVRKDGSEFAVEIGLSPLEGPNGISVTAAIRDITERKEAARLLAEKMAELQQSNEALQQFAHIASHDLQEPLRMVASYTQLLGKRYKGKLDADADEFIGYAVDGTRRMKRLIEDLLAYSRAGRGAPKAASVESGEALAEALGNLKAAIAESGAEVTQDALPALPANKLELAQIFQNLVGNAIKYRGERKPKIHVSARKGDGEWIFSVADNGIGMEEKYFERVFVIFQRLHGRGEYEGTGIGLAICKRILQQQGGRIWVESELGVGSTFYFALPAR